MSRILTALIGACDRGSKSAVEGPTTPCSPPCHCRNSRRGGSSIFGLTSSPPIRRHELLQVGLAGEQKPQQADPLASQGLIDAQEDEIVLETRLRDRSPEQPSARSHEFDGVLSIVVVPRNAVVVQEREEPLPVLLDPGLVALGDLGCDLSLRHPIKKSLSISLVLGQELGLQAVLVDRLNHGFQGERVPPYQFLQFFIEGMLE